MKPFRFTAEKIDEIINSLVCGETVVNEDGCQTIAKLLNDAIQTEENECERVYGHCIACKPSHRWYKKMWHGSKSPHGKPTHQALLWNVQPIGEGK